MIVGDAYMLNVPQQEDTTVVETNLIGPIIGDMDGLTYLHFLLLGYLRVLQKHVEQKGKGATALPKAYCGMKAGETVDMENQVPLLMFIHKSTRRRGWLLHHWFLLT